MAGEMEDGEDLPIELVIELDPPIDFKGGQIHELRLTEPSALFVRQAEAHLKGQFGQEQMRKYQISLTSLVTGVPIPAVEQLPIRKLNEATRFLERFISAGPATGKT
jgi:hypothetical protein